MVSFTKTFFGSCDIAFFFFQYVSQICFKFSRMLAHVEVSCLEDLLFVGSCNVALCFFCITFVNFVSSNCEC